MRIFKCACGAEVEDRTKNGNRKFCDECRKRKDVAQAKRWRKKHHVPAQPKTIKCVDCGAAVETRANNRKFCDDCGKRREAERVRAWRKSERGQQIQKEYAKSTKGWFKRQEALQRWNEKHRIVEVHCPGSMAFDDWIYRRPPPRTVNLCHDDETTFVPFVVPTYLKAKP